MRFCCALTLTNEHCRVSLTCPSLPTWSKSQSFTTTTVTGEFVPRPSSFDSLRGVTAAGAPPGGAALSDDELVARAALALQRIRKRTTQSGDSRFLGRYLFECLLGEALWQTITDEAIVHAAPHLEIGLRIDSAATILQRFPWEMLHGPNGFFAQLQGKVAVTRIVSTHHEQLPRSLQSPPRILFAVGTSLVGNGVRPGAEIFGLFRRIEDSDGSLQVRVLQRASPRLLRVEMRCFRPDVVFFLCHGWANERGGYLELEADSGEPSQHNASQLLELLHAGDDCPPIVILSACYSAAGSVEPLSGAALAPLAAQLVAGSPQRAGVPLVVGMGGRVSDVGCRLFTTAMTTSLVQGGSLIDSITEARQASVFGAGNTSDAIDWALPCVFLSPAIDMNYQPVPTTAREQGQLVNKWIKGCDLVANPTFCDREAVFQSYYEVLREDGGLLALYVASDEEGFGRSRTLMELAAQAIRDGLVPFPLIYHNDKNKNDKTSVPQDLVSFAKLMDGTILNVRRSVFGVGRDTNSQLGLLVRFSRDRSKTADGWDADLKYMLDMDESVTPRVLQRALQCDIENAVRAIVRNNPFFSATARPSHSPNGPLKCGAIVLLDDVHLYGPTVIEALLTMIGASGFGSVDAPIPVVMAYSTVRDAGPMLRDHAFVLRSHRVVQLGEFPQDNDAHLLFFGQLFLSLGTWNASKPGISDRPYALNANMNDQVRQKYSDRIRQFVRQLPSAFREQEFNMIIAFARDDGFLLEANDESRLAALRHHVLGLPGGANRWREVL